MTWFKEGKRSWLEAFCISVLNVGPIPRHVAFIMDGNRRFATKNNMKKISGHQHGFQKLSETLEWCKDIGITEVTVYAFSIENFKRPKDEVDELMELSREKFRVLLEEKDKIMRNGVKIRMYGKLSLLPLDIQKLAAEVMLYSKDNTKSFLNVCMAYTSREEVTTAMQEIAFGVQDGLLNPSDVTESLLEKCLYTSSTSPPDLVIRTSGELRLSDFLLWQSSFSVLLFVNVLWPDFNIWHLFWAVFYYQRRFKGPKDIAEKSLHMRETREREEDGRNARSNYDFSASSQEKCEVDKFVSKWTCKKEQRVCNFLQHLDKKREHQLYNILARDGQT